MVNNYSSDCERPYANGKEGRVWHLYVGDTGKRIGNYKQTLLAILEEHKVQHVLDAACAIGVDSVMLVQEGYKVNSTDAESTFLKEAREERWQRRHEPGMGEWQIGQADWLNMKDCEKTVQHPEGGYDAIICIGNSFCCLPEFEGDHKTHKRALGNFRDLLRPGGVLIIDHRNYDYVIKHYTLPPHSHESIYYNSDRVFNVRTAVTFEDGACKEITFACDMDLSGTDLAGDSDVEPKERDGVLVPALRLNTIRLHPHTVGGFTALLKEVFGEGAKHRVLPDFSEEKKEGDVSYWVHVVTKSG